MLDPKFNDERLDLRDSDFDEEGRIISLKEAFEKYREEAIKNIEEEEQRKIQEEEEKRRLEEEKAEKSVKEEEEQEPQSKSSSDEKSESKEDSNEQQENNQFMTENSFLARIKEMQTGSPSPINKKKKAQPQISLEDQDSSKSSEERHNDIPDMEKLKTKGKSAKVNVLKTINPNLDSEQSPKGRDRKPSVKKKLKIKKKKGEEVNYETKVEKLMPNKRLNTITFEDKKFALVIDETDPDPEFEKDEEIEEVKPKPREPEKLQPVRPNRFDRLSTFGQNQLQEVTMNTKTLPANTFNASRRQKTMERPPRQQFGEGKDTGLLDKWEKQYGDMKDRKFYVKCDHDYDKWYTESSNQKFSSFGRQTHTAGFNDIKEDIPEDAEAQMYSTNAVIKKKGNKLEVSNSHKEFDYDWDEAEESMSYLKKYNDDNLKENYNKYGQQRGGQNPYPVKTTEYAEPSKQVSNPKRASRKAVKTERTNKKHFRSMAPPIDDWDD